MLPLAAMNEALSLLAGQGFYFAYVWEESQPVVCGHPLVGITAPSAFVLDHRDGRRSTFTCTTCAKGKCQRSGTPTGRCGRWISRQWERSMRFKPGACQRPCSWCAIRDTDFPPRRPRTLRLLQRLAGSG